MFDFFISKYIPYVKNNFETDFGKLFHISHSPALSRC